MPSITVRNVPDEVHRALKVRAAQHGRSAEAEIRDILENSVKPGVRKPLGSLLVEIGRQANLSDNDVAIIEQMRDKTLTNTSSRILSEGYFGQFGKHV